MSGLYLIHLYIPQWTRVNLNSNRNNPCAGLYYVRQVPARPYPMQTRFQLLWRGQTFYSTWPIIGIFYLLHYVSSVWYNIFLYFNTTLYFYISVRERSIRQQIYKMKKVISSHLSFKEGHWPIHYGTYLTLLLATE